MKPRRRFALPGHSVHDEHVVTVQARSSCYISLQGVHSFLVSFCRELNLVLSDPSFQIRFLSIGDDLKRKKKRGLFSSGVMFRVWGSR